MAVRIGTVALLLAMAGCAANPPCAGERCGEHGMVLFGAAADRVLAMHLPLYRAPHDRQVVLDLRLADRADRSRLAAALAAGPVTLVPERFDLDRLAPGHAAPLRGFRGQLVQGHFERGGTPLGMVQLEVVGVPLYRPIAATMPRRSGLHYLAVAAPAGWFLVHEVGGAPAFDHVVEAVWAGAAPPPAVLIWPRSNSPEQRPRAGEAGPGGAPLQVLRSVWLETADLAR